MVALLGHVAFSFLTIYRLQQPYTREDSDRQG